MDDELAFLHSRPIGVLATVSADGAPHAVPIEIVVDGGKVYVWCRSTSVKARNVARAGVAALTAYRGGAFVLARGPARLIHDGEGDFARITQMFLAKYDRSETYSNDVLIEITPERISSGE
jgi:PPOX class probable F420-dependent enzyme